MTRYLIDTNVISELIKPGPDPNLILWVGKQAPERIFSSVISLGEIRQGIENLPLGKRRSQLEIWVKSGLPEWFEVNSLPLAKAIAKARGGLAAQGRRIGLTTTAIEHSLTLVTRNSKDSPLLGVTVFNPRDYRP